jgi:hypothetical protein
VLRNCRPHSRAHAYGAWVSLVALIGILWTCGRERPHDPDDVASLHLTCFPVSRGVHCKLSALFRDVSQSPQDVTDVASWQLIGDAAGARISPGGVIDATEDGNVEIDARYLSHRAHAVVRVAPGRPGQVLAILRGRVYVEVARVLRPVAYVRIEITSGPSIGRWTTTEGDGSYELRGVVPGDLMIRATKAGYTAAHQSARIEPGENVCSVLIDAVPLEAGPAL